jgi:hypothetical protein
LYAVTRSLTPLDFAKRLGLLETLDADSGFAWPLQYRLEYAILLFQVGDAPTRRKGKQEFQDLRQQLPVRSGSVTVPDELRFLADPATGFKTRLRTTMRVKDVTGYGRNYIAIPEGWINVTVPFRPYLFGSALRPGAERDCFIEFSNFGPQAVPVTTE